MLLIISLYVSVSSSVCPNVINRYGLNRSSRKLVLGGVLLKFLDTSQLWLKLGFPPSESPREGFLASHFSKWRNLRHNAIHPAHASAIGSRKYDVTGNIYGGQRWNYGERAGTVTLCFPFLRQSVQASSGAYSASHTISTGECFAGCKTVGAWSSLLTFFYYGECSGVYLNRGTNWRSAAIRVDVVDDIVPFCTYFVRLRLQFFWCPLRVVACRVMQRGRGCQSAMLIGICTLYSLYDYLPSVSNSFSPCLFLIIHILHLFLFLRTLFYHIVLWCYV
jgi:hypothetical protein